MQKERVYNIEPGIYDGFVEDGYKFEGYKGYKVEQKDKYTRTFKIPLYAKEYNPFVAYRRTAEVTITGTFIVDGEEKEVSKKFKMIQVHRLVNPTGIWRSWNEANSFDVQLLDLRQDYTVNPWDDTAQFEKFTSDGPWFTEIMVQGGDNGTDWFELLGLDGSYKKNDRIYGDSHTTIDFTFKPKGILTSSDQVRYGIIRVRYNNYTCEHLIFVRQGYAPIRINESPDQAKWYTFNMRTQSAMTESPCEEGSLFKRCRWDVPIDPENNKELSPFKVGPNPLLIFDKNGETIEWDDWYSPDGDPVEVRNRDWEAPNVNGKSMRIASYEDYNALKQNARIGCGVLYDGKSSSIQYSVKDAYSYYYNYTRGENRNGNGMRGEFVYNKATGAQVFFPIGASGYGNRKQQDFYKYGYIGPFTPGMLIYASRNNFMPVSSAMSLPLLFDLFRLPGARYWIDKNISIDGGEYIGGWDLNYYTYNFQAISYTSLVDTNGEETGKKGDAIFIRCVVDENNNNENITRSPKKKKSKRI